MTRKPPPRREPNSMLLSRRQSPGLYKAATREIDGASSLTSSNHLPANERSRFVNPVAFPLGRERLFTNPSPTGSLTERKTIAIERVTARSSRTTGVVAAKIDLGSTGPTPMRSFGFDRGWQRPNDTQAEYSDPLSSRVPRMIGRMRRGALVRRGHSRDNPCEHRDASIE